MKNNKVALLIDGASLHATSKSLGFTIDFKKLLSEFQSRGNLVRANYYTAVSDEEEISSIVPLIDWLEYNGYSVVTKPLKSITDAEGNRKNRGNMDVEIAVDAIELADHVNHLVLFSGNGDFCSLVEAIQRRGVRVTVVSSVTTRPPVCADDLRRQTDEFIDLAHLQAKIARDRSARPLREAAEMPLLLKPSG